MPGYNYACGHVGVGLVVRLNNNKGVLMGESLGVCGCIFVF